MSIALYTDRSDEWSTPDNLFNELNSEFNFTLDPCSSDLNFKCNNHYTIADNGLEKSWKNEVVFCNPPYSNIAEWVKKCYYEWYYNHAIVVLLIPSRTDTKYFHDYIYNKAEIRFIKGRLHFNNSKNAAPFPSMICIWRDDL